MVRPQSVVDVGCGVGAWLSVFKEHGVADIWGIDGDYVDRTLLLIPPDRFMAFDLTRPLRLDRQFDLAISLEVAEHLPEKCADTFVDSLVRLAPIVLFSAGVPFQPGVGHINLQWPDYWVRRFEQKGFVPTDLLRKKLWHNDAVEWWYAQNMLVFSKYERLRDYPLLEAESHIVLSLVHPKNYLYQAHRKDMSLKDLLRALPGEMKLALKRRLDWLVSRK